MFYRSLSGPLCASVLVALVPSMVCRSLSLAGSARMDVLFAGSMTALLL